MKVDPDLYSRILRLRGSHLSPGRLLVVVHLVAHWLLPVDGFGLRGNIEGTMGVWGGGKRDFKLALTNKLRLSSIRFVPWGGDLKGSPGSKLKRMLPQRVQYHC